MLASLIETCKLNHVDPEAAAHRTACPSKERPLDSCLCGSGQNTSAAAAVTEPQAEPL